MGAIREVELDFLVSGECGGDRGMNQKVGEGEKGKVKNGGENRRKKLVKRKESVARQGKAD
jgi:hypothetical protein